MVIESLCRPGTLSKEYAAADVNPDGKLAQMRLGKCVSVSAREARPVQLYPQGASPVCSPL